MLSDETANGQYPIEAVSAMKRVIRYTEDNAPVKAIFVDHQDDHSRQAAISNSIISLAETINARAIVAETKTGATAIDISSRRAVTPLIAVTDDIRTAQQLCLVYSVKSYIRPVDKYAALKLTDWLLQEGVLKKGDIVVTASGKQPGVVGTTDTIKVRMLE
jgi:pyruvate kinase